MNKSKILDRQIIIYLIIICKINYVCTNEVLDLRNVNNDILLGSMEEEQGSITTLSYLINPQSETTEVVEGENLIWEAEIDDEVVTLVKLYQYYKVSKLCYVHTMFGNLVLTRHYEKMDGEWKQIEAENFKILLESYNQQRILDLKSNVGDGTCFIDDHNLGGIGAKVLIPYPKYQLISVMDGPIPVWLRNNAFDCCTSLVVHGTLESPKLINLNLKISGQFEQRYYRFHENSWKEITKHYFYEILEDLDRKEIEKGEEQTQ